MFTSTEKQLAILDWAVTEQQEIRRRSWWEAWYDADYSWEGLAAKPMPYRTSSQAPIPLTLQDFWFAEAEHIKTAPDGRQYTRFHYPFWTRVNGELVATDKQRWSVDVWADMYRALDAVLNYRPVALDHDRISELTGEKPPKIIINGIRTDNVWPVFLNLSGVNLGELGSQVATTNNIKFDSLYIDKLAIQGFQKTVLEDIVFDACLFGSGGSFQNGSLQASLRFKSCLFTGPVQLKNCEFGRVILDDVWCTFLEMTDCKVGQIQFKATFAQPESCRFHHSNISGDADFRASGLAFLGAFDGLKIDGQLRFDHEQDGTPADTVFRTKILTPILCRTAMLGPQSSASELKVVMRVERSRQLRHLESGARTLKTAMSEDKNEEMAHRFYRYELWARNYNPSTERGTRWLLTLYRVTSKYGHDITLPLLWICGVAAVAGIFYMFAYTLSQGWVIDLRHPSLAAWTFSGDAWSFSIGRIAPIIPWIAGIQIPKDSFEYAVKTSGGFGGLLVHFAAILQTGVSTALFFLAGLAARRRFKMSD